MMKRHIFERQAAAALPHAFVADNIWRELWDQAIEKVISSVFKKVQNRCIMEVARKENVGDGIALFRGYRF